MVRQNLFKSFLQSINRPGTVVFMSSRTGGPVTLVAECAWLNIQPNCIVSLGPGQTIATCQRNIAGHVMLRAFGRPVGRCCDMLGAVGSSLKMVKSEPKTPNMSQHVATRRPTHATCCAQQRCDMLRWSRLYYMACSCSQYNAHTEWLIVGHYCSIMPTFQKKKKAKCHIMNNLLTWKVLSLWENRKPGSCHIRQDLGLRFPVGLQTQTGFQLHETSARNLPRFPENITCLGS